MGNGKKGSEAVETNLVSIGLLIIGAVLVISFFFLYSSIYNLLHKGETQGTAESFKSLVDKVSALDNGKQKQGSTLHAYYIQGGFHLLGFNDGPGGIEHRDGSVAKPEGCLEGEACLCICSDSLCKKGTIDCNRRTGGGRATFSSIRKFAFIPNGGEKYNKINQGEEMETGRYYLSIFGKWGGFAGINKDTWAQGTILNLEKAGDVLNVKILDGPSGGAGAGRNG